MKFTNNYIKQLKEALNEIDLKKVESMIKAIKTVKDKNGRIFFLGVGGSSANASHAVNDFRKLCGIESYTPTDNVSELTARTNDEGGKYFAPFLHIQS